MSDHPWDAWIPGVLTKEQVGTLIRERFIENADLALLDYSALDLRLSDEAYELTGGCVKPFGGRYAGVLQNANMSKMLPQNADGSFTLIRRHTYVFRLKERVANLKDRSIYGAATAKSSVGRMDVLARLIVDGMDEYEGFTPRDIGNGDLFLEVTSMTFNVLVRPGKSLAQLRLFKGPPDDSRIPGESLLRTVLVDVDSQNVEGTLSVDLTAMQIAGLPVCAFSVSLQDEDELPIPLWTTDAEKPPNPWQYWKFETTDSRDRLRIRKDRFYIIRSHEKIRLPKGVAVYCRAIDETIGEMRIHYAGFVHPFFGAERTDGGSGTPLIFEVRGHDVDVSLRHREKMARLGFYRMSEDCQKLSDRQKDPYKEQSLKLSQYFAPWPDALNVDMDGNLSP